MLRPDAGQRRLAFYRDKQNRHHLGRYVWASAILKAAEQRPVRVLDCACGVGYGTAMLADVAESVDGVDIFRNAIQRAKSRYARPNIRWHLMDASDLLENFEPETFDAVVSFQTIECIEDDTKFLDDINKLLKPEGLLLIDTPIRKRTIINPDNKHHQRDYGLDDWIDMLIDRFERVDAFDTIPEANILEQCDIPSSGSIACCRKS